MTTKRKILLIDDEPLVRDELGGLLLDEGYVLATAADGQEGLTKFRNESPDMVITDVRMPRRDGLSVCIAIREEAPATPVTVITGHGNEASVLEALRAGVTDFIKKPVRIEDLSLALHRMEAALDLAQQQVADLPESVEVIERTWTYRLGANMPAVSRFVDVMLRRAIPGANPRTHADLGVALRELITNAVEHGSLGLTYGEKSQATETGTLDRVIAQRLRNPVFAQRRVHVWAVRRATTMSVRIRDEGDGFDWRKLPDATDPVNLLADHGRGVLLARLSVDDLTYNEAGNEVTLAKRLGNDNT
ncbi:MAG: response regulator [Polyangiaceae bacterium]|nr:response regulator [Polyangiaceae bacterium]